MRMRMKSNNLVIFGEGTDAAQYRISGAFIRLYLATARL